MKMFLCGERRRVWGATETLGGVWWPTRVSCGKPTCALAFEQQRFYNPHHHPEMPRTLPSFGQRAGHGENYSRIHYDQGCASSVGTSDPGSMGDTFEKEELLRSVE